MPAMKVMIIYARSVKIVEKKGRQERNPSYFCLSFFMIQEGIRVCEGNKADLCTLSQDFETRPIHFPFRIY